MKHSILSLGAAAALASAVLCGPPLFGQDAVQTTTTTSGGTVTEFGPRTIVVKTENAPAPVRYTYSRSTVYVDQNGNPVSVDVVKSGLPVTVYYQREGDDLVASKVVVRRTETQTVVPPPAPAPEFNRSTSTTTTTTTNK